MFRCGSRRAIPTALSARPSTNDGRATELTMDVEMKIRGLVMDPASNMPIVILKDVKSDTVLPIWVGMYEANAIALEIEKSSTPRPMTHDLLKNLIRGLNAAVQKVVVTELKNDTFYAVIWMEQDGEEVIRIAKLAPSMAETTPEELRRWLEGLNDEDLGRYKM